MGEESPPRVPLRATRRGQNIIVASSVAATVVFLGAAVGAFFVGQSLAPQTSTGDVTQVQEVLEVERPVAEFPSLTGGPREPGDASWADLRGGECLRPFETAFAETFSVVLVIRYSDANAKQYPYTFCNKIGCIARIGFSQEDVDLMKAGDRAILSITHIQQPEQAITFPMSLAGFTKSYDALPAR